MNNAIKLGKTEPNLDYKPLSGSYSFAINWGQIIFPIFSWNLAVLLVKE